MSSEVSLIEMGHALLHGLFDLARPPQGVTPLVVVVRASSWRKLRCNRAATAQLQPHIPICG